MGDGRSPVLCREPLKRLLARVGDPQLLRALLEAALEGGLEAMLARLARGLGVQWACLYRRNPHPVPLVVWAEEGVEGPLGLGADELRRAGFLSWLEAPLGPRGGLLMADRRSRTWRPGEEAFFCLAGRILEGRLEAGEKLETLERFVQEQLELLLKLSRDLSGPIDVATAIRRSVEIVAEAFGYNLVSIYLRQGDELVLQHQVGYAQWLERVPIGKGVMARCVLSGQPVLVEDAAQDPDFVYPMPGILSDVAIPLRVGGQTIGVLNVESTTRRLGPADLEILQAVGSGVSLFLERTLAARRLASAQADNLRLRLQTSAQARRLELLYALSRKLLSVQLAEEAVRYFVDELYESFGYALVAAYFQEGKVLVARHHRGYPLGYSRIPLGQGLTSRCFLSGESILLQDPLQDPAFLVVSDRVCSALFVPIRLGGRVVGTVNVEEERRLDEADLELVEGATALLQATLERIQTHATLAQSEQRFRALVEHLPVGVFLFELDALGIRYANPRMEELLGGRLEGLSLEQLWVGENVARNLARVEALRRGLPELPWVEQPLHRMDGSLLEAETTALALPQEGLALAMVQDISERKRARQQVEYLAYHDPLTGLLNRAGLAQKAGAFLQPGQRATLLYLDLNETKMVNDAYGHPAGDQLIQQVAERLRRLAPGGLVARVGGDEFVVLLGGWLEEGELLRLLQGILEAPFWVAERVLHLSLGAGSAYYPLHGESLAELMRAADVAMYQAKRTGQLWVGYTPLLDQDAGLRLEALQRLRAAVGQGQIAPHFQPIVWLEDGRWWGLEALARWEGGAPEQFIPLAEEAGLIQRLDRLMIRQALGAVRVPLRLALNLSPKTLLDDRFLPWLRRFRFRRGQLWLEVTERVLLDDPERVRKRLAALRARGVRIALDDFGSGYSSLAYLSELPIDLIKIDRRFVQRIGESRKAEALLHSVITLARNLGLLCLAEGIERPEQAAWLREAGCALGQGYWFGRPQPPSELLRTFKTSP
ncbi:EAL domain-containing protein [Meiothermus sp. QL-1]|uniref:EAL domain-containing protein n=1 Tax=Meiothermus sp. QL-1 TaxID=2058095 RepID=UPI000E0BC91F|nr:EAL domain-containing protein [Meiothermus sp. QL-1]RDI95119.1 EAL domain-containing protein [Meiothermus sp. QL-1]